MEINDQNNKEVNLLDYRDMKKSLNKDDSEYLVAVINNVENNQRHW